MYKTKKEVDAHVRAALSKLRSETERQLRSFTIAKLYYKINEFSSAEHYLCSYLSIKEDNDHAYKLLGQCYKHLKKPEKALQAFQKSLQLNTKQPDLLADVCQLLLEDDDHMNMNKSKYWCEIAESEKVQHEAVFSLRLKINNLETNCSTNEVENVILKQISNHPNDINLRVRLVRHYVDCNRMRDAYNYIYQMEILHRNDLIDNSDWSYIMWLTVNKYEQMPNVIKDWNFWLLKTICLERQIEKALLDNPLTAFGSPHIVEITNYLFNFDQHLFKVSHLSGNLNVQKELFELFLQHYRGQLLLHIIALVFMREQLQNNKTKKWKDIMRSMLPLLLLAYQAEAPQLKEFWMKHCDEQSKELILRWQKEGSFRCAQVGRILISTINYKLPTNQDFNNTIRNKGNYFNNLSDLWSDAEQIICQIRQICCNPQWRRDIFSLLFCSSEQKIQEHTSFLINDMKLVEPIYELPSCGDVENYEEAAAYLHPESLKHLVYLSLGKENLAHVRALVFSSLNFSTQNLAFCGAESLNQLDVDTFLYAAVLQSKRNLHVERDTCNSDNHNYPAILTFANLQSMLCTEEQFQWWNLAYMMYKNLSNVNDLAQSRATLQYGIEVVRGINVPKMDITIVFKLGQIFVARAQEIRKPVEKQQLEARAKSLFKNGLNMLKMRNKGILEPNHIYFKYANGQTAAAEREMFTDAENAVTYLAGQYFKKAEYEELIDEFSGTQLPFATYLQAEAYRKLSDATKPPKKTKALYLSKVAEYLKLTLSLLENNPCIDSNHPLNSIIHNEIKKVQQASATTHNLNQSNNYFSPQNNSSAYEDAESDLSLEIPINSTQFNITNNGEEINRRDRSFNSHNQQEELLEYVRKLSSNLGQFKKDILDILKSEFKEVKKSISSNKEEMQQLETAIKKLQLNTHQTPCNDKSNMLDELHAMGTSNLQQQMQPQQAVTALTANNPHISTNPYFAATKQFAQIGTSAIPPHLGSGLIRYPQANPALMQMQNNSNMDVYQNAAMFPPHLGNYPLNFLTPSQGTNAFLPQVGGMAVRQPMNPCLPPLNYADSVHATTNAGLNFNVPPFTTANMFAANMPTTEANARMNNNMFCSLYQQPNLVNAKANNAPFLPFPSAGMPLMSIAAVPSTATTTTAINFKKTLHSETNANNLPANVVITSSDPLPKPNTVIHQSQTLPVLSVNIPSCHIKSNMVNKQVMDVNGKVTTTTIASVTSASNLISDKNIINKNVADQSAAVVPLFSANHSINQMPVSANTSAATVNLSHNSNERTSNLNTTDDVNEDEYDPRPDFKGIIPLPDEVVVRTGEEDEEVMFCHRAKLFRLVDKEWKERGIGDVKILKSKIDGISRILMRRDQTYKICANHKITAEINLTIPKNENRGFIWIANDFADESLHVETFFLRFKLPETAVEFQKAFKTAQKQQQQQNTKVVDNNSNMLEDVLVQQIVKPITSTVVDTFPPSSTIMSTTTIANIFTGNKNLENTFNFFTTSTPFNKNEKSFASSNLNLQVSLGGVGSFSSAANPLTTISKECSTSQNIPNVMVVNKQNEIKATTVAITSAISTIFTSTTAPTFGGIFGNLNKNNNSPFSIGKISPTFGSVTANSNDGKREAQVGDELTTATTASESAEDDYEPNAEFKPVIELPELVALTTGEEDDIVLFEHRAKLLRFNKESGEWKERGIGNIKLLQNRNDTNVIRLVMRREQIHKLCCNQRIYKNTKFLYVKNSQTALSWAGQDFSEQELVPELLTVRFKTPETCKQFYDAILKIQANMTESDTEMNAKSVDSQKEKTEEMPKSSSGDKPVENFGDAFKPKPGSWECKVCCVCNDSEKLSCVACNTPKDDKVANKSTTTTISKPFTFGSTMNFKFGFADKQIPNTTVASCTASALPFTSSVTTTSESQVTSQSTGIVGFGEQFKPKAGSWTCKDCYLSNAGDVLYCKACNSPKNSSIPPKTNLLGTPVAVSSNGSTNFRFGFNPTKSQNESVDNMNTVSSTSDTINAPTTTSTPATFTFNANFTTKAADDGGSLFAGKLGDGAPPALNPFCLDKKEFKFTLKPTSPANSTESAIKQIGGAIDGDKRDISDNADAVGTDVGDSSYVEEENNTYFSPVIPLPDKIVVKTGEEDEDVLYKQRAKLYRFIDGEWKERGLGDVKILRHKTTGKLRVVMRRESVLKICLNHILNEDVEYKCKDEKSWLFAVNDFSEGEIEPHKFSIRFRNKEIADGFMVAVKKALSGAIVNPLDIRESDDRLTASTGASTSKVESIPLSQEDKSMADRLQLPYEFFLTKPNCLGCCGCKPEDYIFKTCNTNDFLNSEEVDSLDFPLTLPTISTSATTRTSAFLKKAILQDSSFSQAVLESTSGNKENCNLKISPINQNTLFGGALINAPQMSSESSTLKEDTNLFSKNSNFTFDGALGLTSNSPSAFKEPILFSGNENAFKFNTSKPDEKPFEKTIFGTAAATNTFKSHNNLFSGKSIFANSTNTTLSDSIFGSTSNKGKLDFGNFTFNTASTAETPTSTEENVTTVSSALNIFDLSKTSTAAVDFATLAAKAKDIPITKTKNDSSKPVEFIGLINQNMFSSFSNAPKNNEKSHGLNTETKNKSKTNESNNQNDGSDSTELDNMNSDPHYDPIIALPDEIVVSTGEEEETKLFGERAKLFRWDETNREWKERGVGELKILLHPQAQTYRMILRREHIHKLVLNHTIGSTFIINKMPRSPKEYVWAAMNFAESTTGVLEKFAVRFKNENLAESFNRTLDDCILKRKKIEEYNASNGDNVTGN